MQLYLDGRLVSTDADPAALNAALTRLRWLGATQLELRRAPDSRLLLTFHGGELFLEVLMPGRADGVDLGGDWRQAQEVVRAYGDGRAVKLPTLAPGAYQQSIIGTSYDAHCPLCRLFGTPE